MKTIRTVSTISCVVLAAMVLLSLVTGDFGDERARLVGMAWGRTSLVDVYVGAALVLTWIRWRDGNPAAWAWLPVMLVLGNLGSAGYVCWRAWTEPDVPALLVGPRRSMSVIANPLQRR